MKKYNISCILILNAVVINIIQYEARSLRGDISIQRRYTIVNNDMQIYLELQSRCFHDDSKIVLWAQLLYFVTSMVIFLTKMLAKLLRRLTHWDKIQFVRYTNVTSITTTVLFVLLMSTSLWIQISLS